MIRGQTIIEFDMDIHWQPTVAWLVEESGRGYWAAPLPHLIVLVAHESAMLEIDGMAGNIFNCGDSSKIWDCNIGYHDADHPIWFVLPEGVGYRHSKITLRRRLPADMVPDLKLSVFLDGCPTLDRPFDNRRHHWRSLATQRPVTMPDELWSALSEMAAKRSIDVDQLLWKIALGYAIENL